MLCLPLTIIKTKFVRISSSMLSFLKKRRNISLVTSHQSLVTSHQLLVTSYQLLVTIYQLLVTSHQLLVTSHQLLITSCQLPVTGYQSLVTSHQFLITSYKSLVLTHELLANTSHQLLNNISSQNDTGQAFFERNVWQSPLFTHVYNLLKTYLMHMLEFMCFQKQPSNSVLRAR